MDYNSPNHDRFTTGELMNTNHGSILEYLCADLEETENYLWNEYEEIKIHKSDTGTE